MIYPKEIQDFQRMRNNAVILSCQLDRQRNLPGLLVVGVEWCRYCQQLKESIPELDKIVENHEYFRGGYPVYWVDATERPEVARAFDAQVFPSVWLVNRQGVVSKERYLGSRQPDQLYNVLSAM
jgi:thioredoxin-like negative regulator of GroEL